VIECWREEWLTVTSTENPGSVGRRTEHLIDMDTSPILRRHLEADPLITVIDLREVTFVDSTGLNVLINANRVRADGLVLRSPAGAVARVLELSGMDRMFRIERPELAAD
jgi:anti-anti-sigma factor